MRGINNQSKSMPAVILATCFALPANAEALVISTEDVSGLPTDKPVQNDLTYLKEGAYTLGFDINPLIPAGYQRPLGIKSASVEFHFYDDWINYWNLVDSINDSESYCIWCQRSTDPEYLDTVDGVPYYETYVITLTVNEPESVTVSSEANSITGETERTYKVERRQYVTPYFTEDWKQAGLLTIIEDITSLYTGNFFVTLELINEDIVRLATTGMINLNLNVFGDLAISYAKLAVDIEEQTGLITDDNNQVPLPSTAPLLAIGAAAFGFARCRKGGSRRSTSHGRAKAQARSPR